jgi:hypothetical protein
MYDMPELAARVYDEAAWRLEHPRRDLNFPDVASLTEAEFLAPPPCFVTATPHHRRASDDAVS